MRPTNLGMMAALAIAAADQRLDFAAPASRRSTGKAEKAPISYGNSPTDFSGRKHGKRECERRLKQLARAKKASHD